MNQGYSNVKTIPVILIALMKNISTICLTKDLFQAMKLQIEARDVVKSLFQRIRDKNGVFFLCQILIQN